MIEVNLISSPIMSPRRLSKKERLKRALINETVGIIIFLVFIAVGLKLAFNARAIKEQEKIAIINELTDSDFTVKQWRLFNQSERNAILLRMK